MFRYFFTALLSCSLLCAHSYITPQGYTSEDIQAAIDTASRLGGGTVELSGNQYFVRKALYLKDNVQLLGNFEKTILKKCPQICSPIIEAICAGDQWIRVKDTRSLKRGDSITIFAETLKRGESVVSEIEEVMPGIIFIKDPIPCNIPQSARAKIFSSFPIIYCKNCRNVGIQNLRIDGNSRENPVIDSWWDSGINIRNSSDVRISNVAVLHSPGDGISLNDAHHVHISNCIVKLSARLGIHIGSGSCYTYVGYSKIIDSGRANIINTDGLYLCHGAAFGFYEKNVIQNARGAGISIGKWDSGNVFFNNTCSHNGEGILFREDTFEVYSITFLKNIIHNNRRLDFCSLAPIHYIFMDEWPIKRTIHDGSTFLYSYDARRNEWIHLAP